MENILKTYDSVVAAKYMLALAYNKGIVLNTTKVQKMLYIAYGVFLSKYDHILLLEAPKAWPFGPVFPKSREYVDYEKVVTLADADLADIKKDTIVTTIFNEVIDKYANYTASQLSNWSHSEGGPWDLTTKENGFNWNRTIPNSYIKNYFLTINV